MLAKNATYTFDGFACRKGKQSFEPSKAYDEAGIDIVHRRIAVAGTRLARELSNAYRWARKPVFVALRTANASCHNRGG